MNRLALIIKYSIQWLFLLLMQIFVFQKIYLSVYALPFFYSMFILTLPVFMNRYMVLLLGFIAGLIIDAFYHTGGIHAAALTFVAYLRYYWLKIMEPSERYEENQLPVVSSMGRDWFLKYTVPLVFIHHFLLFTLEAFAFRYLLEIIFRTIVSTLIAEVIIYYSHLLFFRPKS